MLFARYIRKVKVYREMIEIDYTACPDCGNDKPIGVSKCHECLIQDAPPECFMDIEQANVTTLNELARFLHESGVKPDAPIYFGGNKGLSVVVTEKCSIKFDEFDSDIEE